MFFCSTEDDYPWIIDFEADDLVTLRYKMLRHFVDNECYQDAVNIWHLNSDEDEIQLTEEQIIKINRCMEYDYLQAIKDAQEDYECQQELSSPYWTGRI